MSLIQVDLVGWLPDSLKQQIIDSVVTFVADRAKKVLGDEVSEALKRLKSDAAFQDAVDRGLKEATDRFVREYTVEDEDLVAVIARDPDFWKTESVREALLEIIRHPGVYLADERIALALSFADVLRQRINRERVDRAVAFYLRCVAESLWHLEPLRPVYELQMQRLSVERATQMVQELRGMRADVQRAMLALVQAIGEQQKLLTAPDRPTLPEPKKVYHNLPQPDYGRFIGREKELAQVHGILRPYPQSQYPIVVIDGIGGIGKSALALEVAHRYLRDYDHLPGEERFEAIIWTSAKAAVLTADGIASRRQITRTLDDIYTTISVALEREDITRARPEEQDELVCRALTQQRTLLIVDNLETVDDERVNAFLRELPAPTKAIVTTRHRIDVAYPVRLTGMPKEDGLALITQECAKKGVKLTEDEMERLYRRTGGVPLAIVWSVAQMGYGYGVEAVLRRLGQPTEDISRFCFEGAVEHIRSADAYKLLIALSLFTTDASREALGYVVNLPELDRDDGLAELEKLSLVSKQADRFSLLPLVKYYALSELERDNSTEPELREAWLEYFTKQLQTDGLPLWSNKNSFDLAKREYLNVREACIWALENERWPQAMVLIDRLRDYYFTIGNLKAGTTLLQTGLSFADRIQDPEAVINLLRWLGWFYIWMDQHDKAIKMLREAKRRAEAIHSNQLSSVLEFTGICFIAQGKYSEAEKLLHQAFDLSVQIGDMTTAAGSMYNLGRAKQAKMQYSAAEIFFQKAADLAQPIEYHRMIAYVLNQLGYLRYIAKDYEQAFDYLSNSLSLARTYGDNRLLAYVYYHLSLVEAQSGDSEHAESLAKTALQLFEQTGQTSMQGKVKHFMANLSPSSLTQKPL